MAHTHVFILLCVATQEAKARATRTAMLAEYAAFLEFSKEPRQDEGKYDQVLSA